MWSFGLYKNDISCALRVDAASQAWDTDSSRAHGLTFFLQVLTNVYAGTLVRCHSASMLPYFTWQTNQFWKEMKWIWNQTKKTKSIIGSNDTAYEFLFEKCTI